MIRPTARNLVDWGTVRNLVDWGTVRNLVATATWRPWFVLPCPEILLRNVCTHVQPPLLGHFSTHPPSGGQSRVSWTEFVSTVRIKTAVT